MTYKILSKPRTPLATRKRDLEKLESVPIEPKKLRAPFLNTMQLLWKELEQHNIAPPESPTMLCIGSGYCHEGNDLFSFYGPSLYFTGIEQDFVIASFSKQNFSKENLSRVTLIAGLGQDPTILSHCKPNNLLWIRHPDTHTRGDNWKDIFEKTYEKLTVSGVWIMTFYVKRDYDAALSILNALEISPLLSIEDNPHSAPIFIEGVRSEFAHDTHLLVIHKTTT